MREFYQPTATCVMLFVAILFTIAVANPRQCVAGLPIGVRASGQWTLKSQRSSSGRWEADFAITPERAAVSGRIRFDDLEYLEAANVRGVVDGDRLQLETTVEQSGVPHLKIIASMSGTSVEGVLELSNGIAGVWKGTLNLSSTGPSITIPAQVRDRLLSGEPQAVIVHFDDSAIRKDIVDLARGIGIPAHSPELRSLKQALIEEVLNRGLSDLGSDGYDIVRTYRNVAAAVIRVTSAEKLDALLNLEGIDAVDDDVKVSRHGGDPEALALIGQPAAQAGGYIGSNAAVAVVDTGIDFTRDPGLFGPCPAGPDLSGVTCRVVLQEEIGTDDHALDDSLHGTLIGSVLASVGPGLEIASWDVRNADGSESFSLDTAAFDRIVDEASALNIRSVNYSAGVAGVQLEQECHHATLEPLVNDLYDMGVIVVAAAGNDHSTGGVTFPACLPHMLRVGAVYDANLGSATFGGFGCSDATTAADKITCYSNTGSLLQILAPGSRITGAGIVGNGTSFAVPFVAGVVAVVAQIPKFDSDDAVVECRKRRVTDNGPGITDPRNGMTFHRLDLAAVIDSPPHVGDCNFNGVVSIDELVKGVRIALGLSPLSICTQMDANFDSTVVVAELISAVLSSQRNCPMQ